MTADRLSFRVALCTCMLLISAARGQGDVETAATTAPPIPKHRGTSKPGPVYYGSPDLLSNPHKSSGSSKSGPLKSGPSKSGSTKPGNPVSGGTPTAGPRCVNRFPSRPLCKFVDSLRAAGTGGKAGTAGTGGTGGRMELVDGTSGKILRIGVYQIRQKFHRDLPPTKLYAFGTSRARASFPGPTIMARKGTMTKIRWENHLTDEKHMLQVDYTINKDVPRPSRGGIPFVPFRQGGHAHSSYSGHPQAWFTQYGELGPALSSRSSTRTSRASRTSPLPSSSSSPSSGGPEAPQEHAYYSQTYKYLNQHSAALLWYRDRTQGVGRLNLIAGMAGLYVVTDPDGAEGKRRSGKAGSGEAGGGGAGGGGGGGIGEQAGGGGKVSGAGVGSWIPKGDYSIPLVLADRTFTANGSLYYPRRGVVPDVHPNWVDGFYGNTIVVNGLAWPYLKVRPALHRLRLLSAANARFFNLSFVCADRRDYPNFYPPLKGSKVKFAQISSDAGYLVRPSYVRSLLLAPGERKDILVDFSSLPSVCRDVIVTNSAPSPFPNGTPPGSHTGVVMRIVITQTKKIASPKIPEKISNPLPPINLNQAAQHRWKMLVSVKDAQADAPLRMLIDNMGFKDAATEAPRVGTYEIWHIVNLSPIAHPIHIPLALHRPISRRRFDAEAFLDGFCAFDRAMGWASYSRSGNHSKSGNRGNSSNRGSSGNGGSSSGSGSSGSSSRNRRQEKEENTKEETTNTKLPIRKPPAETAPRSCFIKKPKGIPGGERLGWQDTSVVWPRQVLSLWVAWGSTASMAAAAGGGVKGGFGFDATRGPGYAWHSGIAELMDNEAMRPVVVRAGK